MRERIGYYTAFEQLGYKVIISGPVSLLRDCIFFKPEQTLFILQPEGSPVLPLDTFDYNLPVANFQIDTNAATKLRIRRAALFNFTFVFHPAYTEIFKKKAIENCFFLSHCVDASFFNEEQRHRCFDVGWVGKIGGANFRNRRLLIPIVASQFKINEWDKEYTYQEMIGIYNNSKIVVNIAKDDYPQDANLRCFEAMAAGALLITSYPSELSQIGFVEEKDFITFSSKSDLIEKIKNYISRENEMETIASNGRKKVFERHTYLYNANRIIEIILSSKESAKNSGNKVMVVWFHCSYKNFSFAKLLIEKIPSKVERVKALFYLSEASLKNTIYTSLRNMFFKGIKIESK